MSSVGIRMPTYLLIDEMSYSIASIVRARKMLNEVLSLVEFVLRQLYNCQEGKKHPS